MAESFTEKGSAAVQQELEAIGQLYQTLIEFFVNYSFQVVGALIIIFLGWFASKWIHRLILRLFDRNSLDITLALFTANVAKFFVIGIALIIALGKFGISIGPFIAAIGAISLTAGLALQGSIANYGAGIALIISRPFVVGDTIAINNVFGVVEEIKLAYTLLRTEDEELITVPNKYMIGEIMVNSFAYRLVEGSIGVSYDDDIDAAVKVVRDVIENYPMLSNENKPVVGIESFGDSSVVIGMRYWVPTKEYFQTQYAINRDVYHAVKSHGFTIPYPQRDLHMIQPS
jgi:small conductance mechanosensitive channel